MKPGFGIDYVFILPLLSVYIFIIIVIIMMSLLSLADSKSSQDICRDQNSCPLQGVAAALSFNGQVFQSLIIIIIIVIIIIIILVCFIQFYLFIFLPGCTVYNCRHGCKLLAGSLFPSISRCE